MCEVINESSERHWQKNNDQYAIVHDQKLGFKKLFLELYTYLGTENKGKEYQNWLKNLEVIVSWEQNKFCPFPMGMRSVQ